MGSLVQLPPKHRQLRFNRQELAHMFWRAAFYVRRQRPRDAHTGELLAYLEREFRATWRAVDTGVR